MKINIKYVPKPLFLERMRQLLTDKKDFENYLKTLKKPPLNSIRCNTLKISQEELKKRLESKGWKIKQPFKEHPEIMIVEGKFAETKVSDMEINEKKSFKNTDEQISIKLQKISDLALINQKNSDERKRGDKLIDLQPGELGRSLEHLLGYYYIQEIASMLPVIALQPKPNEIILDLCASPGSKTTQMVSEMENKGTIIANDISLARIKILASNLERCDCSNIIITRKEGTALCKKLTNENFLFDKILLDVSCSGEGTFRSSPKGFQMWNINTIKNLSKIQKNLATSAIDILKTNGILVYSTCTHAPEENEEVIDFVLREFQDKVKIEKTQLPIKSREGITKWKDKNYDDKVKFSHRIYPQDNNTEGFFIAKLRKVK